MVMGGVDGKWSLFFLGLMVVMLGVGICWWQLEKIKAIVVK